MRPGAKADLILIRTHAPPLEPTSNLAYTVAETAYGSDVSDSIINGKLVMKERQVLTLDEEAILADAGHRMKQVYERAGI